VRDFVTRAANELGIEIAWDGMGGSEVGHVVSVPAESKVVLGQRIVAVDRRYFRPAEVETLLGDASKAKQKLGWTATTPFAELVREMVVEDLQIARRDALVSDAGFRTFQRNE